MRRRRMEVCFVVYFLPSPTFDVRVDRFVHSPAALCDNRQPCMRVILADVGCSAEVPVRLNRATAKRFPNLTATANSPGPLNALWQCIGDQSNSFAPASPRSIPGTSDERCHLCCQGNYLRPPRTHQSAVDVPQRNDCKTTRPA